MSPLFVIAAIMVLIASYATWASRSRRVDADEVRASFDAAMAEASGPLSSGLAKIARPVVTTQAVAEMSNSAAMRALKDRVATSGLYGQDLNVFLAYQIAAVFIGCVLEAVALMGGQGMIMRVAIGLCGVGIAGWPYNQLTTKAKKAADAAADQLPDFVELLQMPLATGMSVPAALTFTAAQFQTGVVVQEVRWLLDTLSARTMAEEEAYTEAGRRIGSPEAAAFFNALGQAAIGGVKVTESLARQAQSLRLKAHQKRRAKIKGIPVTLVIAFALHFLPLLFVVTMLPMLFSLRSM
jgi:Flp pilus assembly protein TadB